MADLEFFSRLGLYTEENFLNPSLCNQCLAEAANAPINPVKIVQKNGTTGVITTLTAIEQRKT
jgi:hypothetical protein